MQNQNNQPDSVTPNVFSQNNIFSKNTINQNTPFKSHYSQLKGEPYFNQRKNLIQSTATQIETEKSSLKRYQTNNSLEKYYQNHFNIYHSQHDSSNKNSIQERLFHAKLKVLAIMKKLNIYFSERINFAQITIEQAIQQLYSQTKDHIHNLQQRIQQLISQKQKYQSIGLLQQKYKQLHIQKQMEKVSTQLKDLDQIKLLKGLNMQYLQQIKYLMETLHMKDVEIQEIRQELAQSQTVIKAQQDGVNNLISKQETTLKALNIKIDNLKKQRANLKDKIFELQSQNQKIRRENTNLQKNVHLLNITLENQKSELELANQSLQQYKKRFKQRQDDYQKQIKLLNDKYKVESQLCSKKDKTIQSLKKQIDQWMNFQKDRQIKHNEQIQTMRSNNLKQRQKYNGQIERMNEQVKKLQELIYQKQKIIYDLEQIQQEMIKKGQQSLHRQQCLKIQLIDLHQKYNTDVQELIKDLQEERKLNKQNSNLILNIEQKNKNLQRNIEQLRTHIQERQQQFKNNEFILKEQHRLQLQEKQKSAINQATYYKSKIDEMFKKINQFQQSKLIIEQANKAQERQLSFWRTKSADDKKQYQKNMNIFSMQIQNLKKQKSIKQSTIKAYEQEIKTISMQIDNLSNQMKQVSEKKDSEISSWKNEYAILNGAYEELKQKNFANQIIIENINRQYKQFQISSVQERDSLLKIIKQNQLIIRQRQGIILKLDNDKKYLQRQINLLNINLQETRQQILVISEDYTNKQKRFNETLQILKARNNQLNQKYQKELKNRDQLQQRYYKLERQENEKINKLTNQLSQVTVMVQKQHVPKGNFAKLQQFQGKITDLQMKLYEKQTQSRDLKLKLEQQQNKIKELQLWTKSKIKQ